MGFYKFRGLEKRTTSDPIVLPPETMFINGEAIEEHVEGYETLNVQGRELIGREVRSEGVNGKDGKLYTGSDYSDRKIKVTYKLKAESDEKFRLAFEYMNYMLSKPQSEIKFLDDPEVQWIGTISEVEEVDAGVNEVKSSFTITCSNPFKQSIYAIESKGIGEVQIMEPIRFGTVPDEISITLKEDTKDITITNRDLKIELHGDYKAGKEIILKPEISQVTYDGKSAVSDLAFLTDFENFEVKLDDVIKVTPATSLLSLKVRGRKL